MVLLDKAINRHRFITITGLKTSSEFFLLSFLRLVELGAIE